MDRDMLGIEKIASYLPKTRLSNFSRKNQFFVDDFFIRNKLGIEQVAIKGQNETTEDLCVEAFQKLVVESPIEKKDIELLVVITQNPDTNIPHTSAFLHGRLDLPETCVVFDISLGCTGFVHGLSIIQAFMKYHQLKKGLLFTADPYSKIIDQNDKNTALLFGDAGTVTLISQNPAYHTIEFTYGTIGKNHEDLICRNGKLHMNGRAIFNLAAKVMPNDTITLLEKCRLTIDDIDKFVFHQASKYVVNTISSRLNLPGEKVVFDSYSYGNTVSSSIPIILEKELENSSNQYILVSSFGAGLAWASTVLQKSGEN